MALNYQITALLPQVSQMVVLFETGHKVVLDVPFDQFGNAITGPELDAHVLKYAPSDWALQKEALLQQGINFGTLSAGVTRTAQEVPAPAPTFESAYAEKKAYIKAVANGVIDAVYPQWKQLNMQSDSMYAQNAISGLAQLTVEDVMGRAVAEVGLTDDLETLKSLRDNAYAIDLTDAIDGIQATLEANQPAELVAPLLEAIESYFVDMIVSICGYRLIRLVRKWSDTMEAQLATLTTLEAVQALEVTGCPNIA